MSEKADGAAGLESGADGVSEVIGDWAQRESELLAEIADLSAALDAVRAGGVDAVVVSGVTGESLYTLTSTDRPYRVLVEQMGQGAATFSESGIVLYANQRFADLIGHDRARLPGQDLTHLVQSADITVLGDLLAAPPGATAHQELTEVCCSHRTVAQEGRISPEEEGSLCRNTVSSLRSTATKRC
jgi:phosphoserine phosphatase RsbU/P